MKLMTAILFIRIFPPSKYSNAITRPSNEVSLIRHGSQSLATVASAKRPTDSLI